MICQNCHNEFEGNFCNHCGQSAQVKRLDVTYLFKELPNSIFQLNRGFLFTAKEMLVRPGHAIRAFIEGRRKPYYQPVAFLLIVSTIYILVNFWLGVNTVFEDFLLGFESGAQGVENDVGDSAVRKWFSKYQAYAPLFVLPVFSVASFLAFRKSKYNYVEHVVLNVYITAQQFIIFLLFSFFLSQGDIIVLLQIVVGIAFVFWTYFQFFKEKKRMAKLGLILLTYVYFLLIFPLLIYLIGFVMGKLV